MATVEADPRGAPLTDRDRALVDYAIQLTEAPSATTAAHVARLRAAGFEDKDVLEICETTAYYAYVNRIADGLGVTLEDDDA